MVSVWGTVRVRVRVRVRAVRVRVRVYKFVSLSACFFCLSLSHFCPFDLYHPKSQKDLRVSLPLSCLCYICLVFVSSFASLVLFRLCSRLCSRLCLALCGCVFF